MPVGSGTRTTRTATRRGVLLGGGAVAASMAGCISTSPTPPGQARAGSGDGGSASVPLLKAGGSSTVYPITNRAASYWTANYPASDEEYWGPRTNWDIDTGQNLADYWAGKYGFEPRDGGPPFEVTVSLSHSGTGLEKLRAGQLDLGNASAPVAAELDLSGEELDRFENHVVGVDAQPIVVSPEIRDAGVTELTAEQVRAIYRGEVTSWSEIAGYDGPEKEIQAVGRSVGSGTDTAFRLNMLGDETAEMPGIDVRKGQNQQVKTLVANSTNAVAYMALAFVDDSVAALPLEFEGTLYEPGENLADENYPLSRDLHCYTYDGTSEKEAAFLRMILSDFGQQTFVRPTGYAALTGDRLQTELDRLPDAT